MNRLPNSSPRCHRQSVNCPCDEGGQAKAEIMSETRLPSYLDQSLDLTAVSTPTEPHYQCLRYVLATHQNTKMHVSTPDRPHRSLRSPCANNLSGEQPYARSKLGARADVHDPGRNRWRQGLCAGIRAAVSHIEQCLARIVRVGWLGDAC